MSRGTVRGVLARSVLSLALLGMASTGLAGSAQAAEPSPLPDQLVNSRDSVSSQYVEASSPEEADAILTQLELSASSSSADSLETAAALSVRYGPCTLYPSTVYLRASSNYGAVGAKPYTKCTVPVTSIKHSTDLRYKSFIWWRLATTKTGGNYGVASYTQKNVEYYCKSKEQSGWSGTTLGTIVYGGRTYYARVYQAAVSLSCGG